MDSERLNPYREFLRSPHHGWLGLATLGSSLATGHLLPVIAGTTAYVIGWIYGPDLPAFRRWVSRREERALRREEEAKVEGFIRRRDALLASLSPVRLGRYHALAEVCRQIEAASNDNPLDRAALESDPRLRKLDELMWTYVRLLTIEESLDRFLEAERREELPAMIQQAEGELMQLRTELEALRARGETKTLETRQRFFASRSERLEVLRKRHERSAQAVDNLALAVAEQERLDQQIKLIRADAVAMKNASALTARIDATVEHLGQTNRWLAEMDEFRDLVSDLPNTQLRVGFSTTMVPPPLRRKGVPPPPPPLR